MQKKKSIIITTVSVIAMLTVAFGVVYFKTNKIPPKEEVYQKTLKEAVEVKKVSGSASYVLKTNSEDRTQSDMSYIYDFEYDYVSQTEHTAGDLISDITISNSGKEEPYKANYKIETYLGSSGTGYNLYINQKTDKDDYGWLKMSSFFQPNRIEMLVFGSVKDLSYDINKKGKCYVLSGTIDGTQMSDMVNAIVDSDVSGSFIRPSVIERLNDIEFSIYVNRDTYKTEKVELNLTNAYNSYLNTLKTSEDVEEYVIIYDIKAHNDDVENITVPDEIKDKATVIAGENGTIEEDIEDIPNIDEAE